MSDHISKFRMRPDGPEYTVVLKDGLQPHQREPALYHVTVAERDHRIEVEPALRVTTRHAAVNGIQNDLDRAAFVMLDKVAATADLQRGATPTAFTLFHLPTRGITTDLTLAAAEIAGKTTPDAAALARELRRTSRSGEPVVWSVHSRGAAVFDMAARDCAERGVRLDHESVAVYNGAINEDVMSRDLRNAGVGKVGRAFFNHPYDPVPQIVGSNTHNPVKLAGAWYNTRTVVFSDQSLHTWHRELKDRDYASVPVAQWERPGSDLRDYGLKWLLPTLSPQTRDQTRSDEMPRSLDPAMLQSAGISSTDPTFGLLCATIGARDAYQQGSLDDRVSVLHLCRDSFKRDVAGPNLTAAPLRAAALNYVRGDTTADRVLDLALKHSAAISRQPTLGREMAGPDLGLSR